jgi:hypothetical protein
MVIVPLTKCHAAPAPAAAARCDIERIRAPRHLLFSPADNVLAAPGQFFARRPLRDLNADH